MKLKNKTNTVHRKKLKRAWQEVQTCGTQIAGHTVKRSNRRHPEDKVCDRSDGRRESSWPKLKTHNRHNVWHSNVICKWQTCEKVYIACAWRSTRLRNVVLMLWLGVLGISDRFYLRRPTCSTWPCAESILICRVWEQNQAFYGSVICVKMHTETFSWDRCMTRCWMTNTAIVSMHERCCSQWTKVPKPLWTLWLCALTLL